MPGFLLWVRRLPGSRRAFRGLGRLALDHHVHVRHERGDRANRGEHGTDKERGCRTADTDGKREFHEYPFVLLQDNATGISFLEDITDAVDELLAFDFDPLDDDLGLVLLCHGSNRIKGMRNVVR